MVNRTRALVTSLPRSNVFLVYNAVSNQLIAPFGGKPPRPEFIASRRNFTPVKPLAGEIRATNHAAVRLRE